MMLDEHVISAGFRTRSRTITETDLVAFSALTGDRHPQHSDALWAASSAFGERIAHGMLVLSYAIGLVELDPERIVAMRAIHKATFKQPVRIGDTISVRGRLLGDQELGDVAKLLRIELRIVRDDDEKLIARLEVDAVARVEAGEAVT
ncbi:MAG TPA: MaoC/PaaZ C-terminal domain-containing protein [Solirubrobacteraceae bacterium]|nr:MaoC/PaaZ C-terminal domain-containing protein [Solirubrobacteraceae bacterium]